MQGVFPRYPQGAFFQRVCVFVNANANVCFFYLADKLNVSFGTIWRWYSVFTWFILLLTDNFSISTWRSCAETDSACFGEMMRLAMRELKDLMEGKEVPVYQTKHSANL